ncbi:MAG: hypothetical protein JW839_01595 [Candidatus Lokiarchaeota archaeon]|nr:hypothetical protein [Candidatus Lokiarchaeota archaeon]
MAGITAAVTRVITGRYPARASWLNASLAHAILAAFLAWSWSCYPGEYSVSSNAVSNLGDPLLNPWPGWLVFSAGIFAYAVLMIPHACYVHRKLAALDRDWGRRFITASIVGNAGYVGIAVFSEAPATFVPHVFSAMMAFWGLFSAAVCSWFPLIACVRRSTPLRFHLGQVMAIASMVCITSSSFSMVWLAAFLTFLRGSASSGLLSMVFWEWMLVGSLAAHTFLLTGMVNNGAER